SAVLRNLYGLCRGVSRHTDADPDVFHLPGAATIRHRLRRLHQRGYRYHVELGRLSGRVLSRLDAIGLSGTDGGRTRLRHDPVASNSIYRTATGAPPRYPTVVQ